MKNIILLISLITISFTGFSQSTQGYGHAPSLSRSYQCYKSTPYTAVNAGYDTLVASTGVTDTGFAIFNLPNRYTAVIDLFMTRLSGTFAGSAILYGSNASTQPATTSSTWQAITGYTTYCAGCIGASATLTGTGTTQYTWHVQPDGLDYQYYMVKPVATGTCTATYTLRVVTKI